MMIEEMIKYLSQCPFLEDVPIRVNFLGQITPSCALKTTALDSVVKEYTDGSSVCEARFSLALRMEYSGANQENRDAAFRCENIEGWIKAKNQAGDLPEVGGNRIPLEISVIKSFGTEILSAGDGKYEAEIKLVYFKNN